VAYTYLHIIIVAGVIVTAVSDEFVLAHPGGHTDGPTAFTVILGPLLFLIGNLLFKRSVFQVWPLSHLAGIVLLLVWLPAFAYISPVELSGGVAAVLILVGVWENMSVKQGRRQINMA
jgi:low temperature requirement protein LtrA